MAVNDSDSSNLPHPDPGLRNLELEILTIRSLLIKMREKPARPSALWEEFISDEDIAALQSWATKIHSRKASGDNSPWDDSYWQKLFSPEGVLQARLMQESSILQPKQKRIVVCRRRNRRLQKVWLGPKLWDIPIWIVR